MPFTLRNLKEDLEDVGSNFDGAPDLEFRLASKALALDRSGLSYQRIPPGYRFPYGHTHNEQEEVYVVVRGSGRMKLDDEIVDCSWLVASLLNSCHPANACPASAPRNSVRKTIERLFSRQKRRIAQPCVSPTIV